MQVVFFSFFKNNENPKQLFLFSQSLEWRVSCKYFKHILSKDLKKQQLKFSRIEGSIVP